MINKKSYFAQSLILQQEHGLRIFENNVLRISGSKR